MLFRLRGDRLSLGRKASNEIPLDFPSVSSFHCEFNYNPEKRTYEVHDLGSTNGTLLNDEPLGAEPIALNDADELLLGESVLLHVIDATEIMVDERVPEEENAPPTINPVAAAVAEQLAAARQDGK